MKTYELIDTLQDHLATDTELVNKSVEVFSKVHKVYSSGNLQTPPENDNMPAIVIDSLQKRNISAGKSSYTIMIAILNYNETINIDGNKISSVGWKQNEILREETCKAILRGVNKFKAKVTFVDGGTFPNSVFPVFSSTIQINFEYMIPNNRIYDYL